MEKMTHIELTDIQCQDVKARSFDVNASNLQVNKFLSSLFVGVGSVKNEPCREKSVFRVQYSNQSAQLQSLK